MNLIHSKAPQHQEEQSDFWLAVQERNVKVSEESGKQFARHSL